MSLYRQLKSAKGTHRFCTVIRLMFPPRLVFFTQALESWDSLGAVEGTVVDAEV